MLPASGLLRKRKKKRKMRVWKSLGFIAGGTNVASAMECIDNDSEESGDWRSLPRERVQRYDHEGALQCINRDYLGPAPLFADKQFDNMFRISRSRFQRLMEDFGASPISFYTNQVDAYKRKGISMEAKLLLPLKTMAYGVAPHTFRDYFSMSKTMARACCVQFDVAIIQIYENEYLRAPTKADIKSICSLHKKVHTFDGMFGSLDCSHIYWKNCPVGWHGAFKGKEKKPTIILEAISDYHLFIWHASFGYAGTLNDKSVLNMSPFLTQLTDGQFEEVEKEVVPFKIGDEEFNQIYILVDGIYPKFSRFVHGMKKPITVEECRMTEWQEASRKDIERAFGVLQGKWQCIARPMHQINLEQIGNRVTACIILHNMGVSDRVMDGDPRAVYDPMNSFESPNTTIENPNDLVDFQGPTTHWSTNTVGDMTFGAEIMAARKRWSFLADERNFRRLHVALMKQFQNESS
jgi:Plant transposon protein